MPIPRRARPSPAIQQLGFGHFADPQAPAASDSNQPEADVRAEAELDVSTSLQFGRENDAEPPTSTQAMQEDFHGQCQCGALRYRVSGTSSTLFACHCTDCQRQSASAFGMALWVRDPDVEVIGGVPKEWVRTMPSGRQMACRFCGTCGTRLFHQVLSNPGVLSIKPGTLDDTSRLRPVGHIWISSKQPWLRLEDDCLQYPGNPESYEELLALWSARSSSPTAG